MELKTSLQRLSLAVIALGMVVAMGTLSALADSVYLQTNLTSDISGLAAVTSANLVNPWGMSFSATSPIWVSDQGTGVSTVYNGTGSLLLTVTVPSSITPPNGPTGQVNNSNLSNFGGANFIFDTLAGTINARVSGTNAPVVATTSGAVYTGLALATSGGSSYVYAANFTSGGGINVFNSSFTNITGTTFAGKFVDPSPIPGYAPYNIQTIGGNLYVEYAEPGAKGAITGAGLGYVDVFDSSGNFIERFATGGPLNAPWGVALAPSSGFGSFSGDLLVGNFGSGEIDAFNPTNGSFLGTLDGSTGLPLVNSGLWALDFGNGGAGTSTTALYFTAGINGETDGLFGDIQATPEPGVLSLLGAGLLSLVGFFRRKK